MEKKKDIVLLCHCILNFNSKIDGISDNEENRKKILKYLIEKGYGIIQLPCPEITLYGVRRWGHVKEQFDNPYFRKHCRKIFLPILEQLQDYIKNGYNIKALIGENGSPSCGVDKTCSSALWGGEIGKEFKLDIKANDVKTVNGSGIFIEEIQSMLKEKGIDTEFIAIDESSERQSADKIIAILERNEKNEKDQ